MTWYKKGNWYYLVEKHRLIWAYSFRLNMRWKYDPPKYNRLTRFHKVTNLDLIESLEEKLVKYVL